MITRPLKAKTPIHNVVASGLDRMFTPRLIHLYLVPLLAFTIITYIQVTFVGGLTFDRLGGYPAGDHLGHYIGGEIALRGDMSRLYTLDYQAEFSHEIVAPDFYEEVPDFISPPFMAYFYVPFAALPYAWSLLLWLPFSILVLGASLWLLWPLVPKLKNKGLVVWMAVFASYPALGVLLGQDSALLLLVLIGGLRLLNAKRDLSAGVVLGLAMFKPHLIVLIPILLICQRRWRALAAFCAVSFVLLGISIVAMGGVDHILSYLAMFHSDGLQPGSDYVIGKMQSLIGWLGFMLPGQGLTVPLAAMGGLAYLGFFVRIAMRPAKPARQFQLLYALAVLGIPFISIHFLYYDIVLMILPILLLFESANNRFFRLTLAGGYLLITTTLFRQTLFAASPWPLSLIGAPWLTVVVTLFVVQTRAALTPATPCSEASAPTKIPTRETPMNSDTQELAA